MNNLGLFCIRTIAGIVRIGKSTISSPRTKGAHRCVRPAKPVTLQSDVPLNRGWTALNGSTVKCSKRLLRCSRSLNKFRWRLRKFRRIR